MHSFWRVQVHPRKGRVGGKQNQGAKREHFRSNTMRLASIFSLGTLVTRTPGTSGRKQSQAAPRPPSPRQRDTTMAMKQTLQCSELRDAIQGTSSSSNPHRGLLQPCPAGDKPAASSQKPHHTKPEPRLLPPSLPPLPRSPPTVLSLLLCPTPITPKCWLLSHRSEPRYRTGTSGGFDEL